MINVFFDGVGSVTLSLAPFILIQSSRLQFRVYLGFKLVCYTSRTYSKEHNLFRQHETINVQFK